MKKQKPKLRRRGSITVTPTGGYQARIRFPRDALTGARPGVSKVFSTSDEAQSWLAEELARMDRGERLRAENKGQTLRGWLEEFYTTYKAGKKGKKLSARTMQTDCEFLRTYVYEQSPALADTPLARLTTELIAKHFATLGKDKPHLAAATVGRVFRILKARLSYAVKLGKIRFNPAVSDVITIDGQAPREHKTLTFEQTRALLDVCSESKHGAYFATLIWCGLRPGEGAGLTWPDVDLENGRLSIRRALVRLRAVKGTDAGSTWENSTTKTKKARTVPIPPELVAILAAHKVEQARLRLQWGAEYQNNGLVFCSMDSPHPGSPLTLNAMVRRYLHPMIRLAALRMTGQEPLPVGKVSRSARYKEAVAARTKQESNALEETAFPLVSLYELRHSMATLLLRAGTHPKVVADRLGHSKTSVTLDIYSHVTPDLQDAAVDALVSGLTPKVKRNAS